MKSNSFANIRESIEKNNKKAEKMPFLLKKSCLTPFFRSKKRYFS